MRRVLLTGATGRIGGSFFEEIREKYWFRLASRSVAKMTDVEPHETFPLDVADLDACQEACRDIDTVLHLAANPSPQAGFYEALLDQNLKGAYNIFQATLDQGCRRVVYASSIQLNEGYPLDTQVSEDMPTKAVNMYGVCKAFAESAAHYYSKVHGLSCLCVRVGNYAGNSDSMEADARRLERVDQRARHEPVVHPRHRGRRRAHVRHPARRVGQPLQAARHPQEHACAGRLCAAGQLVRLLPDRHRQRRAVVHGGGEPHAG